MDFEQLAFIEKWRRQALRGHVVLLDGTRGDLLVTVRVGELGDRLDLRGRDATGAARKARLSVGDRVTMAIEYAARDIGAGTGSGVTGGLVCPGAEVVGTVTQLGETASVDCGSGAILVRGDTLPGVREGDCIRFTIDGEGKAYLIPSR